MPEISDAALAELQQAHSLLKALHSDSKIGFDFRKMVKQKFPNASIPELEVLGKTEEFGANLEKKLDDFLKAQEKKELDGKVRDFDTRLKKIAKDRGYTEEGEKKLLEIMATTGVQTPEDAVILFEARQPKDSAKPRQFSSRMQFIEKQGKDDADFDNLMNDPEQWMADQLMNGPAVVVNEE